MQPARLLLGMVFVFFAMVSLGLAQSTIPISPVATSPQLPGTQFTVEVKVGDAAAPVSDLFGLSFVLNYTHTSFVDVVGTPTAGSFLGNDIIFFPNVEDANGKVSVGMSRKGGVGVNGSGVVLQAIFTSLATTPNGTAVQFTITEINATDANGAPITLTPTATTVIIGTVQCPAVSGINPASGAVGTSVTITGTNFSDVTAVKFSNNVTAAFTVMSAAQISTTVPNGAVTGPITISKTGCTDVQTGAFTVNAAQAPPIAPVATSPQVAGTPFVLEVKVGDSTAPVSKLFGLSFALNYTNTAYVDVVGTPTPGSFLGNDIVFLPNVNDPNGKVSVGMSRKSGQDGVSGAGTVLQVTFTSQATTPNGTAVEFTITEINATDVNAAPITLNPAALTVTITNLQCPTVTAIAPAIGTVGTAVAITGTNFTEVTAVKFANNVPANFTVTNATQILATVPAGAVTGPITISKAGCADVQTSAFTVVVCPTVSGIDPASGLVGAAVTITGTNFTDVTAVKFANNVSATFTVTSATQISTTVPAGAVSGPITISKAGCTEVQTGVFTVIPPRFVRVVNTTASVGNIVMVSIELDALGDENALGFSLTFDPAILSNPQAARGRDAGSANLITNAIQAGSGRFGLALALPAGQKFAAGTREIAVVSFAVSATTKATSATIEFGDQPIPREVVDANAGLLPVTWIPGTVTILAGYEGDVTPRPHGNNGVVAIDDWVQVGRFVARLDTPRTEPNEFQRADCAPRNCGDGSLGVSDWVQAGRYAAALDPIVAACGPLAPGSSSLAAAQSDAAGARMVRGVSASFDRGQTSALIVELEAQGDENALGFSLSFDPNLLAFQSVALGSGAAAAQSIVNSSQAANGRLGIVMALPAGQKFVAGTQQILKVAFFVNRNTSPATTVIEMGNQPVFGEVADVNATSMAVTWTAATIAINVPTAVDETAEEKMPTEFALEQNYPNPFNPSTNIAFSLPQPSHVTLKVFTVLGEEVATLVDREFAAGRYEANWDAGRINGGIYFYRLQAGSFVQTKRLILMK